MPLKQQVKIQKGFSLIELLIVIIIVSLVYFLAFSGIEKTEEKAKALNPLNLKSSIQNSELFQGTGTLLCINNCRSCYLRKDINAAFEAYENKIDLEGVEVYTLDANDALYRVEYGRYDDAKICLTMQFYRNGSSTKMILKQKDAVYLLPSYFGEAQKVDSLEDAKELWLKDIENVTNRGDYY